MLGAASARSSGGCTTSAGSREKAVLPLSGLRTAGAAILYALLSAGVCAGVAVLVVVHARAWERLDAVMSAVAYSMAFHARLFAGERAVRCGPARQPDRRGAAGAARAGGRHRDAP